MSDVLSKANMNSDDNIIHGPTVSKVPLAPKDAAEKYMHFPVFESGKSTLYSAEEAAKILLNPRINPKLICEAVPPRVQRNYSFIINMNALGNQRDITADDNGSYKSGQGRPSFVYCKSYEEDITFSMIVTTENRDIQLGEQKFILTKFNSVCSPSTDFHRCILRLVHNTMHQDIINMHMCNTFLMKMSMNSLSRLMETRKRPLHTSKLQLVFEMV